MILPMLVVDKNIQLSLRIQGEWLKRGISTIRVDTMQEAIEKLTKESFLFTAINADNIHYLPQLRIMSDISPVPVFIATSNFMVRDQTEALRHGADGYAPFHEDINESIDSALALLERCTERNKQSKKSSNILTCGNLSIYYGYHQVFCNDIEVDLTKKEFDVLYYLLSNRNIKLSYRQISRKVWREDLVSQNAIWQVVYRLRAVLDKTAFCGGYIKSVNGVGYRFSTSSDK